jgi:hypothetical protein
MTRRIVDNQGHRWPITEHRCPTCRKPALLPGEHPGCARTRPVAKGAYALLIFQVAIELGAQVVETWLIAGTTVGARQEERVSSPRNGLSRGPPGLPRRRAR